MNKKTIVSGLLLLLTATLPLNAFAAQEFLNVSYDPTRELYQDFNKAFGAKWK